MAATTMELITSLIKKLAKNNPELSFEEADGFAWDPTTKTVYYNLESPHALAYFLHECGHALLDHRGYSRDITLIAMERDAWKNALEIATSQQLEIESDVIEASMDTYRDWMHARSVCPSCGATGIQTRDHAYTCVSCQTLWRVNEARTCALRRYAN